MPYLSNAHRQIGLDINLYGYVSVCIVLKHIMIIMYAAVTQY